MAPKIDKNMPNAAYLFPLAADSGLLCSLKPQTRKNAAKRKLIYPLLLIFFIKHT